jgi:hypothetical protein
MKHIEKHFSGSDTIRDVVIGMSDGLTVPFALAAGLTGAISQMHLVLPASGLTGQDWLEAEREIRKNEAHK